MHIHVSALQALIYFLMGVVTFGTARLTALAHSDNRIAQAWLLLF